MREIAWQRRELRPLILGHPNAYPGLVEWIKSQNQSESRSQSQSQSQSPDIEQSLTETEDGGKEQQVSSIDVDAAVTFLPTSVEDSVAPVSQSPPRSWTFLVLALVGGFLVLGALGVGAWCLVFVVARFRAVFDSL